MRDYPVQAFTSNTPAPRPYQPPRRRLSDADGVNQNLFDREDEETNEDEEVVGLPNVPDHVQDSPQRLAMQEPVVHQEPVPMQEPHGMTLTLAQHTLFGQLTKVLNAEDHESKKEALRWVLITHDLFNVEDLLYMNEECLKVDGGWYGHFSKVPFRSQFLDVVGYVQKPGNSLDGGVTLQHIRHAMTARAASPPGENDSQTHNVPVGEIVFETRENDESTKYGVPQTVDESLFGDDSGGDDGSTLGGELMRPITNKNFETAYMPPGAVVPSLDPLRNNVVFWSFKGSEKDLVKILNDPTYIRNMLDNDAVAAWGRVRASEFLVTKLDHNALMAIATRAFILCGTKDVKVAALEDEFFWRKQTPKETAKELHKAFHTNGIWYTCAMGYECFRFAVANLADKDMMKLKNSVLELMLVRLGQSVHPGDCRKADLATMLSELKTELKGDRALAY